MLRRLVTAIIGAEADGRGLAFTDYREIGDEVGPFFRDFHGRLDALPLDLDDKRRVVDEGRAGFEPNIALTDELARDHSVGTDRADSSVA